MGGDIREVNRVLQVIVGLLALLVDASQSLPKEDHSTTGTTERLVGSGGDNISVEERRRNNLRGNETRDMSHINHKVGADEVSDLAHASVVNVAAVCGGTGNESLGAVENGSLLEHVIVNDTGCRVNTVGHGLEVS